MAPSVAILGGGISGLSTAYYLLNGAAKSGTKIGKLFVIESQSRFGGYLQSVTTNQNADDYFELGPRTISTNSYAGTNAIALAGDIGLGDAVKFVSKKSANFNKRYVVIDGKLFQLPSKFTDLFRSRKPFKPFVSYLIKDFRTPPLRLEPNEDISVDSFFKYRFGNEIADYLVNPLCIGISGGNSKALSMKSMFPNIFLKEQTHGSVVKGMFAAQDIRKELANHWLVKRSIQERWAVFSFHSGIQAFSDQLRAHLEKNYPEQIELMLESEVVEVKFADKPSKVELKLQRKDNNTNAQLNNLKVDHVFSSLSAFKLSAILTDRHHDLKLALKSIPTVHMAVVSLQFDQNVLPDHLTGFGFLVPSRENSPLLGVTFDSCIFSAANCPGTKLTVMLGGYRFDELFGDPDVVNRSRLVEMSLSSLRSLLSIQCDPIQHMVTIHKDCIPQYALGHQQRLNTIESEINDLSLSIVGASFHGFSVPECILNAKIQADAWLQSIK